MFSDPHCMYTIFTSGICFNQMGKKRKNYLPFFFVQFQEIIHGDVIVNPLKVKKTKQPVSI